MTLPKIITISGQQHKIVSITRAPAEFCLPPSTIIALRESAQRAAQALK